MAHKCNLSYSEAEARESLEPGRQMLQFKPRSRYYTPAWVTDSVSKKNNNNLHTIFKKMFETHQLSGEESKYKIQNGEVEIL